MQDGSGVVMPDIVDARTRSRIMSGIKGKDTKPEMAIRSGLHRRGVRFRLHDRNLPGKPDIVLRRYGAVIFIHGCFWHGHDCSLFRWPATRSEWWRKKIEGNRARDRKARENLENLGWRQACVWECALKGRWHLDTDVVLEILTGWLDSDKRVLTIRGRA